jgi:LmbE family N-acetylglucosaminyl deacetylase
VTAARTLVVVSPHLDDAVLSLPCTVRAWVAREARVVVLTAFTEGDEGYAIRRDEDRRALSLLGAEPLHAGLLDAPYRRSLSRTFRDLVLPPLASDDADAAEATAVLAARVAALAPDVVLLPLGVGEHVDHRVVHAMHARLSGPVGFYEDRPYALVRHAVRLRLARVGALVDGVTEPSPESHADEYVESARRAAYVQAYLPEPERAASLRAVARLPSPGPGDAGLVLRRERSIFDTEALGVAVAAVRAYASQTADLFGERDLVTELRGGQPTYAETVYWREPPVVERSCQSEQEEPTLQQ